MTSLRESARRFKERLSASLTTRDKSIVTTSMVESSLKNLAESTSLYQGRTYEEFLRTLPQERTAFYADLSKEYERQPTPEPQRLSGSVQEENLESIKTLAASNCIPPSLSCSVPNKQIDSGYSPYKYNPAKLQKLVPAIVARLRSMQQYKWFDCIALSGSSGTWLGGMLVCALEQHNIGVILVRKPGENSHGAIVESNNNYKECVFVDDFVSSGATYKRVQEALAEYGVHCNRILEHREL